VLLAADIAFHGLHLTVMGFNLFGWCWRRLRVLHRWCVGLTAFMWLVVGFLVGVPGYCPLTDWHWQVKRRLGEAELPASYVTYLLQKFGFSPAPVMVDVAVGMAFAVVLFITVRLWWRERRQPSR
jgi:hypothetical protein